MPTSTRGFASMDPKKRSAIAQKGGRSGGPGRGWHGDPAGHARAGRKGGRARRRV